MMVSRTEIAVMSDGRKVSIRRITSKRNPARKERGGGGINAGEEEEKEEESEGTRRRPDDGLITLRYRDTRLIPANF